MKIYMIKTNKECYITDCDKTSGHDYTYHNTKLKSILFDRQKVKDTFCKNWFVIDKYPEKIEKEVKRFTNKRYEIDDKDMICSKFKEVVPYEDMYDDIRGFYTYKCDELPNEFEDVDCEIEVIMELEDLQMPKEIKYDALGGGAYKDRSYTITNANVQHQMIDKIIFPGIMIHDRPCKLTSKQMYDITRQYIKDNIDLSKAKITSDYDFCFAVKKIVPLIEPETIQYSDIFARTKKERSKIHYKTKQFKEVDIFSMTHKERNYDGYTAIEPMFANNENELKGKIDAWLEGLIEIINKPLEMCSHCGGNGYLDDINKININVR